MIVCCNWLISFSYFLLFFCHLAYFYFSYFANYPILDRLSWYFCSWTRMTCFSRFQPSSICSLTLVLVISFSSRPRYLASHLSSWQAKRSSDASTFLARFMAFFESSFICILLVSMTYVFSLFYLSDFHKSFSRAATLFLSLLHSPYACLRKRYSASVMMT